MLAYGGEVLVTPDGFGRYLARMGIAIPVADLQQSYDACKPLIDIMRTMPGMISDIVYSVDLVASSQKYAPVLAKIGESFAEVNNLPGKLQQISIPSTFPSDFLQTLICDYLRDRRPRVFACTQLIGCIVEKPVSANDPMDPDSRSLDYVKSSILWHTIAEFLLDFPRWFKNEFGWGSSEFDADSLLSRIGVLCCAFLAPVRITIDTNGTAQDLTFVSLINPLQLVDTIDDENPWGSNGSAAVALGARLVPVPGKSLPPEEDGGVAFVPFADVSSLNFNLTNNTKITFAGSQLSASLPMVALRPKSGLSCESSGQIPNFSLSIEWHKEKDKEGNPAISISPLDGVVDLACNDISLRLGISPTSIEFCIDLASAEVSMSARDADGFLKKILPADGVRFPFSLSLTWSPEKGFSMRGDAGIEYTTQVNESIGPITVTTVDLAFGFKDGKLMLTVAASANAALGPVSALVTKIGLKAELNPSKQGNLGKADLSLGFKPPTGIGLAIGAAGIGGGGYLEIEDGNYAGILQIDVVEVVSVTAIAILTTKMPDGSKIFSLKILGMVEFPPIQLGLGFILSGVGLAVAVESTMDEEALRNAVYSNSLSSLLFPPDPVKHAAKIISDLKSFFPAKPDYLVIGAMVKMGWGGATTLVVAKVGIFIELYRGSPTRIALAGLAGVILPTEDSAVLVLQMQFIGILDFGKGTLSLDASLSGSHLLSWTLDGDIALRSSWKDTPRFALSCGGFYPGFKVPSGFPILKRLSLTIGQDNPRIGLFMYMALAENSVQFGSMLLFHYEKTVSIFGKQHFEINGQLSFDALFKFNPFYFEAHFYATLDLKRNGSSMLAIHLNLMLSGPNNYHAVGSASCKVLGCKVSFDFDETFGDKNPELPQAVVSPGAALVSEVELPKNWDILVPAKGANLAIFRDERDTTYVDTFGKLRFHQRSVPLELRIQKFGEAAIVPGEDYFALATPQGIDTDEIVEEPFAPAQFTYLSDQEKVSAPPFENMKSGLVFSSKGYAVPAVRRGKEVTYETKIIVQPEVIPSPPSPPPRPPGPTPQPLPIPKPLGPARPVVSSVGGPDIPHIPGDIGRIRPKPKYTLHLKKENPVTPAAVEDWQRAAGKRYHNRFRVKPPEVMANRIAVKEQRFAVAGTGALKGKFDRSSPDMTYAQARQAQASKDKTRTRVMPASKVRN